MDRGPRGRTERREREKTCSDEGASVWKAAEACVAVWQLLYWAQRVLTLSLVSHWGTNSSYWHRRELPLPLLTRLWPPHTHTHHPPDQSECSLSLRPLPRLFSFCLQLQPTLSICQTFSLEEMWEIQVKIKDDWFKEEEKKSSDTWICVWNIGWFECLNETMWRWKRKSTFGGLVVVSSETWTRLRCLLYKTHRFHLLIHQCILNCVVLSHVWM